MKLLTDWDLARLGEAIIDPFLPYQVREGLSYGLSSFGYDIRLGSEFLVPVPGELLDVKELGAEQFRRYVAEDHFDLAPHTYVLGSSLEWFNVPEDTLGIAVGKSTLARAGVGVNITPLEPGWNGRLTIEIFNLAQCAVRLYVGEGIAQIIFFRSDRPQVTYQDRRGKYLGQKGVTPPRLA